MGIQSQDVENQTNRPGQQGSQSPQQPKDRPTPQSGQDKGKDQGQNPQTGNKGGGTQSRPA